MGLKENSCSSMGSAPNDPVVKEEQTEVPILPLSNAQNRENIVAPAVNGASAVLPHCKMEAKEPDIVKKEDPEVTEALEEVLKEVAPIPTGYSMLDSANEIHYTPENFLKEGVNMVKDIKAHVNRLEVGSKLRKDVWLRDITSLENQGPPSTMIAVCGATGAGKSSALNAILDDNIVPTSGMRACTAVVTEISYHKEKTIEADISFLTEKEWRDELKTLLDDLLDDDGQFRRSTDLRTEAGVAWHKVHALYPALTQDRLAAISRQDSENRIDTILRIDSKVASLMGTTKKINCKTSKEFAKEISKYIDSKDQKRGEKRDKIKKKEDSGPALWPLIRQVNIRCNSKALSTGSVLVDLPGVADANAARSSIARDYMKKADCVWILAPITRAVDDKTAKDLLGDAFKSQLMNGNFSDVESTITFIATKCDDISCTEVIGSLGLEDDPILEEIEERLDEARREISEWKRKKVEAEKATKGIMGELENIRAGLAERQEHLQALEEGRSSTPSQPKNNGKKRKNTRSGKSGSPKRRRDVSEEEIEMDLDPEADCDDDDDIIDADDFIDDGSIRSNQLDDDDDTSQDDSDNEDDSDKSDDESVQVISNDEEDVLDVDEVKAMVEEKKAELKNARERLSEARRQRKAAMDMISHMQEKQNNAQKDKNAFCSQKRSDFSRDVLKEDFRTGLKELDDAAEEKRNPTDFDPSVNLRDYNSIDLPVFTISSRDYIRITKQIKGDGEPTCFSAVEETGIPDLQNWCHVLTVKSHERAARSFRNQLRVFATSVKSYVDSFGAVSEADRESLRQQWESVHEPELYTMSADEDDESGDDGYDWVYQQGRIVPIARTRTNVSRVPVATETRHKDRKGVLDWLAQEFRDVVAASVKSMQRAFKDSLEEKCEAGADAAAEAALETSDTFAASMHWASYRATLRREGVFRRNLNEELISPMMKTIASSWARTFETSLFSDFETQVLGVVSKLLKEVEESCPAGLQDRAHRQGELCLEEVKVALRKTVDVVSEELASGQKDVSRCLEPHVRAELADGYSRAIEERGPGSVARQKAVFRRYVEEGKDDLFDNGAEVILERLDKVAIDVGKALAEAMDNLAEKIEVSLSVLWESTGDNLFLVRERAEAVECIDTVLRQLTLWETADTSRNARTIKD